MSNQVVKFKEVNKALDCLKGFKIVKETSRDGNSLIIEASKKDQNKQIEYVFFINNNEKTIKLFEKKTSDGYCSTRQYSRKYDENMWKDIDMSKIIIDTVQK